ncbi:hypothetical protein RB195_011032 [Necator americanus]|uniref:Ground-like domain-containing protein n=1 Tax=Necator americanus TaxID=51031 RepID=A0ABR1D0P2_NECAM
MNTLITVWIFLPHASSFFFPTSSTGCHCNQCPQTPSCPLQPTCPPVQSCPEPVTECCPTCTCKNKKRTKRSTELLSNAIFIVDYDTTPQKHREKHRQKRDVLDDVVKVDAKCNSEELRAVIIENIDRMTSVSKRRIQAEAERQLGGRYNVICARGDFSYITNTESFCQQTTGDVTCYVFKQLSDIIRARLS